MKVRASSGVTNCCSLCFFLEKTIHMPSQKQEEKILGSTTHIFKKEDFLHCCSSLKIKKDTLGISNIFMTCDWGLGDLCLNSYSFWLNSKSSLIGLSFQKLKPRRQLKMISTFLHYLIPFQRQGSWRFMLFKW